MNNTTVILKERAGLGEWRLLFLAWDNVLRLKYKGAWLKGKAPLRKQKFISYFTESEAAQ